MSIRRLASGQHVRRACRRAGTKPPPLAQIQNVAPTWVLPPCPTTAALAAQGIYGDAANGIRVFAGQRAETFYIDLGAVFDTLNLRRYLPLLTASRGRQRRVNPFGVNRFSGSNISTIAIEVPITHITSDGQAANSENRLIGIYASTSRQKTKELRKPGEPPHTSGPFVQVSRMGNPLVNEMIRPRFKDQWKPTKRRRRSSRGSTRTPSSHGAGAGVRRAGRADLRPAGAEPH